MSDGEAAGRGLLGNWVLDSLKRDSEIIDLVNELDAEILAQRLWYEQNKDKPLL